MASGSAQLSGRGDGADAVAVDGTIVHGGAEVRGVQFAEVLLDHQQGFPEERRGVLHFLESRFAAEVRRRTAANGDTMSKYSLKLVEFLRP